MTLKHISNARDPFESQTPFYVLIETQVNYLYYMSSKNTQGSNKEHDDAKLDSYLTTLMENEVVVDGVVAQDSTQAHLFWVCFLYY